LVQSARVPLFNHGMRQWQRNHLCLHLADTRGSFASIALGRGTSLLVRLNGRDPQCLAVVGPDGRPACWQAAAAEALRQQARLAQLQQGLQQNGTRRALLQQQTPGLAAMSAASQPTRTLTCGAECLALLGYSGYDSLSGWCSRARQLLQPSKPTS
jgi:hypothetical protein